MNTLGQLGTQTAQLSGESEEDFQNRVMRDATRNVIRPNIKDERYFEEWQRQRDLLQQKQEDPRGLFQMSPRQLRQQGVTPQGSLQPPVVLASMGQRYQDMPPATFADRFGAPPTPEQERAQALQLFLQEQQKYQEEQRQLQRTPEYTWPAGFIRL